MIIKAKHNFILDPFFRFYVIWKMKRSFHLVSFKGEIQDKNRPVLVIGNHVSWWDGIWALHFNRHYFNRKFYFMMQEEQLRKNCFFQYTGGFSVRKKSKSVVESLNYAAELLSDKNNMVLLFPTGKIQSMHQNEFIFEKGVEKILQKTKQKIQVVFMVNLVDYFSNPKPVITTFFEDYNGSFSTPALQTEFNRFYQSCTSIQKLSEK